MQWDLVCCFFIAVHISFLVIQRRNYQNQQQCYWLLYATKNQAKGTDLGGLDPNINIAPAGMEFMEFIEEEKYVKTLGRH